MLIDTHAHVNFNAYKDDSDEVIRRALSNNVWMINVGSQYSTSRRSVRIAEQYKKGVYAAVGLHPVHLSSGIFKSKIDQEEVEFETREEEFDYKQYRELCGSKKVVAVGEIGLDYYYRPKTKIKLEQFKSKQKEVLLQQLQLVQDLKLPVIFHCRAAHDDLIKILRASNSKIKGVVHCFTGTWQQAREYLDMGLCLGLNGIIFKLDLNETIKKAPLEKILLETDCPYLTPSPMTGRNEPLYVRYVADKIAEIRNTDAEQIATVTTQSAKDLFGLPKD